MRIAIHNSLDIFAHLKIMELLQKTYSDQRLEYNRMLKSAIDETNPEKAGVLSDALVAHNQKMSQTVSAMVQLVAQTESKVNLDVLRDKLLSELVEIQNEIVRIRKIYGEQKVLKSIHDQYSYTNTRNDWTILAYILALGIGILLVILVVIKNSFFNPAMPPLSTPVTSVSQGLL